MSVVVNVRLSLMNVMSPPPALCNLSLRTVVKLCTLGVLALGVSMVSCSCGGWMRCDECGAFGWYTWFRYGV